MYKKLLSLLVLLGALSLSAAPKFFATVDIADNYWKTYCTFRGPESPKEKPITAGSYTLENMREMVDVVADMGFTRLYWLSCISELSHNGLPVLHEGKLLGGKELLKHMASFCHARGIEFFIIIKPFENGGTLIPPGCPVPEGFDTVEGMQGTFITSYPIVAKNPGVRLRRRMSPIPRDTTVAEALIINRNDTPVTLTKEDFQFFAGPKNGVYREITDFTVEPRMVERDYRTYSALAFKPVGLTAADRFFLIKCLKKNDKPQLVNTTLSILELRNAAGEIIPRAVGTGAITSIPFIYLRLNTSPQDTRIPEAWNPPKEFGSSLEKSAFDYDCTPNISSIQVDGQNGYIAFAAQEVEYLSSLHPCHPEIMVLWKEAIDNVLYTDADGVDIRFGDHASWTVYGEDYGFNAPVVAEFKRRYGVDVLTDDNFDRALWRKLSGEYITDFMRWSSQRMHAAGKAFHVQIALPVFDRDFWTRNDAPENFKYEWKLWMDEKLVDGISLKYMPFPWGARAGTGVKSAKMLVEKARALGIESSIEARTFWWVQPTDSNSPPYTDEQYNNHLKEFTMLQEIGVDALNFYEVSDYFMIDAYGKPQHSQRFIDLLNDIKEAQKK